MKPRTEFFKQKEKKKSPDEEMKALMKKIEQEEKDLLKCEIPGKEHWRYLRPWKL